MASVRELTLRLTADTKDMAAGIDQVQSKTSKIGGMLKGAAAGMAAAFTVDKVVEFGKAAIDEASAVSESVSKIGQVFGASAKQAESFARNANKSMGLSDRQATEMVGTLGNMFTGFGKSKDEALGLSKGTMQLAADLGSFNNLGTDEVIDMMSGAFRGEYDSIQRILPGLSGTAVAQEALAQTGKTSADSLTDAEKAMAAFSLMTKQAGPAVGDFARTSGGAANQQKILQANLDDVKANLGAHLLPAWTAVLRFISEKVLPGFKWFGDFLSGPFVEGIKVAAEFVWRYIEAPFNQIVKIVQGVWQILENFVELVYNIFTGKWGAAWNNVKEIFLGVFKIITSYLNLFWIYIQTVWNAILAVLSRVGSAIWHAILWPFEQGFNAAKWVVMSVWGAIQDAWNGVTGFFMRVGRGIKDAITWPFREAWEFIKNTWNSTLGKIHFTVPSWVPGIGGKGWEMPKLAKGGIVSRPTLALIGEAGPEAVVPLKRGATGGNTFNINVTAGVGDPVAIGRQVALVLAAYEGIAGPRPTGAMS